MKVRATLAALMITAAIAPSANATIVPPTFGPEGTKLRSEIIDKGFGCTKIKDTSFTCTHKNKKVTLTAYLAAKGTHSRLNSLQVTAHVRSGQPWIVHFINEFKSSAQYEGINLDSWVNQSCLKNKTTHLGGYNEFGKPVLIWGINYSIKGSDKACTLKIWGYFT